VHKHYYESVAEFSFVCHASPHTHTQPLPYVDMCLGHQENF